ncbi:MAG: BrnT family toxin [Chloroflexota bacterium]
MDLEFTWDEKKAEQNWRKHGVSFQEAKSVFDDPLCQTYPDPGHSTSEERVTVGYSDADRLIMVSHSHRGLYARITNARLPTRKERLDYERFDRE